MWLNKEYISLRKKGFLMLTWALRVLSIFLKWLTPPQGLKKV